MKVISCIFYFFKKIFFISIFLFITNAFSQAPVIQWQKSLGGTSYDGTSCVQQTSDGGYIVAGSSNSINGDVTGNHGGNDFWIVKLNASGTIQWQKSLGGTFYDNASSIHQTLDGGYIVAGTSTSNDGDVTGNHGNDDYWIVKLDASGIIQWQKSLGGTDNDYGRTIQQTIDGGYILCGSSHSNNGDVSGNHGIGDYWVVKLDVSGTIQWQKCLGGTNNDDASSIHQTLDGGYIVAGSSNSNDGDVTGNHGGNDYWVVKLDASGIIQWQKCLGGASSEQSNSVHQTSDGGYVVAGYTGSVDGDITANHGSSDYWIVKLNTTGNIQWQKSLGGTSTEQANSMQLTTDGGCIVTGCTHSIDGDVVGNDGGEDCWCLKLDASGNIQWQKPMGGLINEIGRSIQQTSDGGYIVAGWSYSNDGNFSGNHGGNDYLVVKLFVTTATNFSYTNPCYRDSTAFALDDTSGIASVSWSFGDPFSGANSSTKIYPKHQFRSAGNFTVSANIVYRGGATQTITQTVTIKPPPPVQINRDVIEACSGAQILLLASGANTYQWFEISSPTDVISINDSLTVFPANTKYFVTGTDTNGCTFTDTVKIISREGLIVQITALDSSICFRDSVLMVGSGSDNYSWSILGSSTILSTQSGYLVSPIVNTDYVLSGSNEYNCIGTDTITITVLPPPSITISAGEDSICPGDQARLAGRGGISYGWYNKLNPGSFISADSILFAGPSVTSTYVVVGTDANGCTASAEQTLVVKPRPVGPGISGMPYMCPSSQNILYTANPFQPLSSYTWWVSTGLSKSYENKDTLRVNFGSPGTFTISLQERNEYKCYGDVINYSVEVQQVLTPPAPEGTDTVCSASASQTYNVPFSNPGSSYNWQVEGGTVQSGNGSPVVTINWTSMGVNAGKVWYIESTSGIPPCIWISDTLKVSIFPSPNTSAIMGDSSLCIGTSGLYSVNSNTSSIYSWNLNQGFGVISAGQGTRFIQVNWNSIGMDTLKVTETSPEGCPGPEKMLQVMVNPFPVIAPGDVQGPALVCYSSRNGSIYYLNNSNPSSRYYWSIQGGELIAGNGSDSIRVNWEENNLHNVNVYEKSKDSCVSQAVTVPVTLDGAAPEINAVSYPHNNNTEIEISWQLSYNLGQLNSYNLYKRKYKDINSPWSLIANNYYSNSYKDQNIRPQDEAYEYQYTITDACGDSSTSAPHHSMLLKAVADRASNKIYLSWNHYHNWKAGVERYEVWRKLDDEVNYSLYKEHGKDSSFSSQNGTEGFVHCYKIKAIEAGGNNYSWSNDTCVSFSNQLHIPSAYSPNGDGVNDNWVIRNIGAYKNAQVEIFNRWGELVFKSLQYHNEWDGNLNGKKLPDATYYYVIKLNQENEAEKQSLSGIVTIVK